MKKLNKILKKLKRVVVAYSGGLDSTFLLKAAIDALGRENVVAVTARSETYPKSEYCQAKKIAKKLGAKLITIETSELSIPRFRENPVNRCYYCKKELFKSLDLIKKRLGMNYVLDGTNFDDLKDIRYGRKAAKELGVKSPLLEARIGKADIRKYSRALKLPTWDKPSFACLASRIPFNTRIEEKSLGMVEAAEEFLRSLGFGQVRVRIHDKVARIELGERDIRKVIGMGEKVTSKLRKLGFTYVTLDLLGYRTGSMHEA